MDKAKYSKYCLVPQCESTSIKTPGKIFISLPVGSSKNKKKRRILWLRAMRRNTDDISENTRGFVCEDHFNVTLPIPSKQSILTYDWAFTPRISAALEQSFDRMNSININESTLVHYLLQYTQQKH
ncbi:hypothetical protein NQ317_009978 [Molorchus minor]|uniref:THAP-type domain-containing protein n=1 Tax=Molorchus minor TaxID=1323400 RepID=A0ABQ9K6P5_9CUCU|nr:hypothetical protein NQ317_009978 [Molorchus minor]